MAYEYMGALQLHVCMNDIIPTAASGFAYTEPPGLIDPGSIGDIVTMTPSIGQLVQPMGGTPLAVLFGASESPGIGATVFSYANPPPADLHQVVGVALYNNSSPSLDYVQQNLIPVLPSKLVSLNAKANLKKKASFSGNPPSSSVTFDLSLVDGRAPGQVKTVSFIECYNAIMDGLSQPYAFEFLPDGDTAIIPAKNTVPTHYVSARLPVKFKKTLNGLLWNTVTVYAYRDSDNFSNWKLLPTPPSAGSGAYGDAIAAANTYTATLQNAILDRAKGIDTALPPDTRPAATLAEALTTNEKAILDNWWSEVSAMRSAAANKPLKTPGAAYQAYTDKGGTLTKPEFEAALESAKSAPPAGKTWFENLTDLLGTTANAASDAVVGLGQSGADVLKDWGPVGSIGAFAGYKAISSSSSKDWFPWVIGGAALLLLMR